MCVCVFLQQVKVFDTEVEKGAVQSAITFLAKAHFKLLAKQNPFYGNDVIKIFIWKMIEFSLYDHIVDYKM